MAGPTPVSALIHAATMVTAGVYLCCRISPVIVESTTAMAFIAIVGSLTALVAASIALVQNEMKKILAYSTVSQLGFMFAAVGMGAFAGGIFHVFTHAFFKACLFLGAGSVMHAIHAHGDADIRYLGGLRKYMPTTHWTFAIATAAIAGLPLLSGFFSKDEILLGAATWGAESTPVWNSEIAADQGWFSMVWANIELGNWAGPWVGWFVFGTLIVAATLTAFYMFRLYFRTFWGEYKGGHAPDAHHAHDHADHEDEEHHDEPHESPDTMTVPLMVLAAGAAVVGFLGLPHLTHLPNLWSRWLTPQYEAFVEGVNAAAASGVTEHEALVSSGMAAASDSHGVLAVFQAGGGMVHAPGWVALTAMVGGLLAALLGFGLAFVFYFSGDGSIPEGIKNSVPGVHRFLMDKWRIDELYNATVVRVMKWAGVLAGNLDRIVVDGLLAKVSAFVVQTFGYLVTRLQNGVIFAYAALFVFGFAGLAIWFTYPQNDLVTCTVDDCDESLETDSAIGIGQVRFSAPTGRSYTYRWDFDSDGVFETDWVEQPNAEHDYRGENCAVGEADHHAAEGEAPAPTSQRCAFHAVVAIVESPNFFLTTERSDSEQLFLGAFGRREYVLERGDRATRMPEPALGLRWERDPEASSEVPTFRYATVLRYSGTLPSVPNPAEDGTRTADIAVSLYAEQEGGEPFWATERTGIAVSETGTFAMLLGVDEPLSLGALPDEVWASSGEGPRARIDAVPQTGVLVAINGANIPDADGIPDGLRLLEPGDAIGVQNRFRLVAAAQFRATVEVKNAFETVTRETESVTVRVPPPTGGSAPQAMRGRSADERRRPNASPLPGRLDRGDRDRDALGREPSPHPRRRRRNGRCGEPAARRVDRDERGGHRHDRALRRAPNRGHPLGDPRLAVTRRSRLRVPSPAMGRRAPLAREHLALGWFRALGLPPRPGGSRSARARILRRVHPGPLGSHPRAVLR